MQHPATHARLIQRLRQERLEIEQTLRSLDIAGLPVQLDQSTQGRLSRIDAISQQSMAKAGQTNLRIQLTRIDAAVRRFEEGRYGTCCKCGEPVAIERLNADPATPLCMDCADTDPRQRA